MRLPLFLILSLVFITGSCQNKTSTRKENNTYLIQKTDEEWKEILTDEQFYILRQQGTEYAFSWSILG